MKPTSTTTTNYAGSSCLCTALIRTIHNMPCASDSVGYFKYMRISVSIRVNFETSHLMCVRERSVYIDSAHATYPFVYGYVHQFQLLTVCSTLANLAIATIKCSSSYIGVTCKVYPYLLQFDLLFLCPIRFTLSFSCFFSLSFSLCCVSASERLNCLTSSLFIVFIHI